MKKPTRRGLALKLLCLYVGSVKTVVNVVCPPLFSKYLVWNMQFIASVLQPFILLLTTILNADVFSNELNASVCEQIFIVIYKVI